MDKETGRVGIKRYGGIIYEEFLPELRGIKGVRVYQEMADNDDVVGAILFAIKMLIRQAQWSVQPASNDDSQESATGINLFIVCTCLYQKNCLNSSRIIIRKVSIKNFFLGGRGR